VGDRATEGTLFLAALDVDMNPLVVASCFGKFIDPILVNYHPLANTNFISNFCGISFQIIKNFHVETPRLI